ncbi:MAG: radical SAM protein, partial [Beijerinckiaceae bacterium]
TRVSIGVQDFDAGVQKAINRIQTVEETRRVIDAFRDRGVTSLNIDAIYGLPGQTRDKLFATLQAVADLNPDRIALFGYAHVPWMKTHQKMIDEAQLPGLEERFDHAESAAEFLVAQGYERIGLDHFARPGDAMARAARNNTLKRNFQGYTVDPADALIGFGASSIGALPQGYAQNVAPIAEYQRRALAGALPVAKGFALAEDDVARRTVIERLMCDMRFDRNDLLAHNDDVAQDILHVADALVRADDGEYIRSDADGFIVTDAGRPLLRTIAARFDAYLSGGKARHSSAV